MRKGGRGTWTPSTVASGIQSSRSRRCSATGLTKTKFLVLSGQIRSIKDGGNRRILPGVGRRIHPAADRRAGRMTKRRNGECSIFPYRTGYAAYAWVTTPDGASGSASGSTAKTHWRRSTTSGSSSRPEHVRARCQRQPRTPATYLSYWLNEVVQPNLAPKTSEKYKLLYSALPLPGLGHKRLDQLQVRDVRTWLNNLRTACQCCAQLKDARRPPGPAARPRPREMLSSGPWRPDHQRRARHAPGCSEQRCRGGTH